MQQAFIPRSHRRGSSLGVAMLALAGLLVAPVAARADLFENLLIGLNQADYNVGVQKNYLGKGWDFDAVAPYTGQTYRFGFGELTLGETSATNVRLSAGYTTRGLPSARFSLLTDGQPLSYTLKTNYGVQEFEANGSVLFNIDTNVNALGFYEQTLTLSNRGTFTTDGIAAESSAPLDFDVGPIVLSGNVYMDLLGALTEPIWQAAGTENPLSKLSQRSAKVASLNDSISSLEAKLAAGDTLSSSEAGQLVNNRLLTALLGGQADALSELVLPSDLAQALIDGKGMVMVPEPASMLLLLGAVGLALRPQRRRPSR